MSPSTKMITIDQLISLTCVTMIKKINVNATVGKWYSRYINKKVLED